MYGTRIGVYTVCTGKKRIASRVGLHRPTMVPPVMIYAM